jgi:type I restriction enzyme R subunit
LNRPSEISTISFIRTPDAPASSLLRLRYHDSIEDALADLGKPEEIGKVFASFQRYLYEQVA